MEVKSNDRSNDLEGLYSDRLLLVLEVLRPVEMFLFLPNKLLPYLEGDTVDASDSSSTSLALSSDSLVSLRSRKELSGELSGGTIVAMLDISWDVLNSSSSSS